MTEDIKIVEQYEWCIAYDCDKVLYVCLKKWVVESNHRHEHEEVVFLMEGKVEAIIEDKTQIISSPAKIIIPPNTYHKFTALTDVIGLEIK